MNHRYFIFYIILSIIAFSCSSMNNRKIASSVGNPTIYYVKEGELIGKNFFEVFGGKEGKKGEVNIFDQYGVTLTYHPQSVFFMPRAFLRIEKVKNNLIYIWMDNSNNITSIGRVNMTGNSPQVAVSLVRKFKGIEELANILNIDPSRNEGNFEEHQAYIEEIKKRSKIENSIVPIKTFNRAILEDSNNALGVLQHYYAIKKYDKDSNTICKN